MNAAAVPTVDVSVLIVGAGPTGLTLACDLARRGVDFRIVEKAHSYFAGSRGKGLQPRSMEVLEDLGVIDQILECGRFHLPFRAYDGATILGDRDLHEGRHPTPDVPGRLGGSMPASIHRDVPMPGTSSSARRRRALA